MKHPTTRTVNRRAAAHVNTDVEALAQTGSNPYYERLIRLRQEQPEVFAVLSPVERLTLGYYEAEKRRQALINDELNTLPPAT